MKDKENLSLNHNNVRNESAPDSKRLWFRILLVYGSNQHYVKPIKVCQQHRKESNTTKGQVMDTLKSIKPTEPINLTKPFPNKISVSNRYDITWKIYSELMESHFHRVLFEDCQ